MRDAAPMDGRSARGREVDRGPVQLELATVGPSQLEEPLGKTGQVVDLGEHVGPQGRIVLGERLDPGADVRERRPQLMGGVGGEAGLGLVGLLHGTDRSTRPPPPCEERGRECRHATPQEQ